MRTPSAASTAQLADYLRECRCTVAFVDDRTIDVGVADRFLSPRHQQVELDGYVRVWQMMQANVVVERLTTEVA